jgi:large subunit ribosomal protein L32
VCPRCRATKLPHTVCGSCGWYKGRVAVDIER